MVFPEVERRPSGLQLFFLQIEFQLCIKVDRPINRVLIFGKTLHKPLVFASGGRSVKMPGLIRAIPDRLKGKEMAEKLCKVSGQRFHFWNGRQTLLLSGPRCNLKYPDAWQYFLILRGVGDGILTPYYPYHFSLLKTSDLYRKYSA